MWLNSSGWAKWLGVMALWWPGLAATCAADPTNSAPAALFDYAHPSLLTGTVYSTDTPSRQGIFKFRRTATQTGSTVKVERRFDHPDGSLAAVETIVYESGQLATYEMKDPEANLWGAIQVTKDPKNPARQKITLQHGRDDEPRAKGASENFTDDMVIDDTLVPFVLKHWDELMKGKTVHFQFISLEFERTVGFKIVKTKEFTQDGRKILRLRMEPSNLLAAQFINPLYFSFDKASPHHLLEYTGRTTPRVKKGKAWKYLDAETVFDWTNGPSASQNGR